MKTADHKTDIESTYKLASYKGFAWVRLYIERTFLLYKARKGLLAVPDENNSRIYVRRPMLGLAYMCMSRLTAISICAARDIYKCRPTKADKYVWRVCAVYAGYLDFFIC